MSSLKIHPGRSVLKDFHSNKAGIFTTSKSGTHTTIYVWCVRSLKFHPGRSVLKEGTYDFPNARAVCVCVCVCVCLCVCMCVCVCVAFSYWCMKPEATSV